MTRVLYVWFIFGGVSIGVFILDHNGNYSMLRPEISAVASKAHKKAKRLEILRELLVVFRRNTDFNSFFVPDDKKILCRAQPEMGQAATHFAKIFS